MSRRLTFGEKLRRAAAAPRLSQAEIDAYLASDEYAQEQREARAAWADHERERRRARNPAPTVAVSRTTPRTRERRDTGARQTVAAGDDSESGEPPLDAAEECAAAAIEAGWRDPATRRAWTAEAAAVAADVFGVADPPAPRPPVATEPTAAVWYALERLGLEPRGDRSDFHSRCPVHLGDSASLHVSEGDDGRALLHCFAHACTADSIRQALGLGWQDLFGTDSPRRGRTSAKPRDPVDVVLTAVREHGLEYRATPGGQLWVVESCPACRLHELWLHEDGRRVRLTCLYGCPQQAVLDALTGTADRGAETFLDRWEAQHR